MKNNHSRRYFFLEMGIVILLVFLISFSSPVHAASDSEERVQGLMELIDQFGFPVYEDSEVSYYPETEEIWAKLLDDLKNAKESIFLEFYELDDGQVLDSILDILFQKREENVDVRIIYDAIGSRSFSVDTHQEILSHGIPIQVFHPISFSGIPDIASRDHRKIAVIDGKVAYTGGFNLADQYFNVIHPYGRWKDSGVRITGEGVKGFLNFFTSLWNEMVPKDMIDQNNPVEEKKKEENKKEEYKTEVFKTGEFKTEEKGLIQPYTDFPGDDRHVSQNILLYLLKNAKERVYLISPYLMLEREVLDAFEQAVTRGVDVRVITPRIPDKVLVYAATKSYYPELMKRGVKILEFVPGFIHSKVWLMDEDVACVGSVNLDLLSFYNNQEVSLVMYGMEAIQDVIADFESLFSICEWMN